MRLQALLHDLAGGARSLLARPAFTLIAVLTLGLSIGAHTTLFGIVNALLLSPVSGIGQPDRLVEIGSTHGGSDLDSISYPDFVDIAASAHTLDGLYAYAIEPLNVSERGDPQRALGMLVSGSYFSTLRVQPAFGRLLATADDTADAPPAVVASHAAWQKYLGADPALVGRTLSINGRSFTLVGVAASDFHGQLAVVAPDFYFPLHSRALLREESSDLFTQRNSQWLLAGGRLRDGATLTQVQTELTTIRQRLDASYATPDADKAGLGAAWLRGIPAAMRGPLGAFSGLLFVMIGMILLVASINIAGLLIARGEQRRQEIAIRLALGASRMRVFRQLFAESLLLALTAGVLGVLLATWWRDLLLHIDLPTPFPITPRIPIDLPVLLFAFALAALTAVLFGVLPALRASRAAPATHGNLVDSRNDRRGTRLRETLVVAQITLTLVLLIGSGLFVRALQRAAVIDTGFDAQRVLSMDFDLEPSGYAQDHRARLQTDFLAQVRAIADVEHAALAALLPLSFNRMSLGCVALPGVDAHALCPDVNVVSDGFFQTLAMPLQGRGFNASDRADGTAVAVVNETLARRIAGDGDAIGRSFRYGEGEQARTLTVIGIVPDGKYASLGEQRTPFLFLPLAQWPFASTSLVARVKHDSPALQGVLAQAVRNVDRTLPIAQSHPLQDTLALSLLPQRIAGIVAAALGSLGLLLAAIGLYGLLAFHVASRTREIGIRLSLGAAPQRILHEVLARGGKLVGVGLLLGSALGVGLALLASSLLFGARFSDVLAFVMAGGLIALVAFPACYLPARQAVRVQPVVALRHD